jgi:pyruvate dehydrogenase (quinone)
MQLGEFATAVRLGLDLKLLVISNGTLGQIKWEQILFLGNQEFGCELPRIDFARAAEAMGGKGFRVEDAAHLPAVMDAALATPGPVVIEAVVDPNEPLLPAVVSETYAKNIARAIRDGTAGAADLQRALERDPAHAMMTAREGG